MLWTEEWWLREENASIAVVTDELEEIVKRNLRKRLDEDVEALDKTVVVLIKKRGAYSYMYHIKASYRLQLLIAEK